MKKIFKIYFLFLLIGLLNTNILNATNITYTDFSDISAFTLTGATEDINSSGPIFYNGQNVLRLTDALSQGVGQAIYKDPISLGLGGFSTAFSFQITDSQGISDSDGQGGDGIWFILSGLSNNLIIEFDTFQNTLYQNGINDPDGNHIGILDNWEDYKHLTSLNTSYINTPMNDGAVKYAWIDYDHSTFTLEVRFSETDERPTTPLLTHNNDLYSYFNTQDISIAFHSYTGAGAGDHDIRSWEFTSSTPVPEPSTWLLLCFAMLGMVWIKKV